MALSEKWVLEKARGLMWNPEYTGFNPVAFTRAIEAEVRKDDDALIRQLVEALEGSHATLWEEDDDPARPAHEAIKAARARLEQPCA